MLNIVAKALLVATSLAPILGVVAMTHDKHYLYWGGAALLLVLACWLVLWYASKNAETHEFHIKEFERNDTEALVFLLAYMLPLALADNTAFTDNMPMIYFFVVIILVIVHADALHFNPVMWLLGYRFYAVKNGDGVSYLLISKNTLKMPGKDVQTVSLADGIYLHTGEVND